MKLSELIEIIGNIKNSYQPIVKDEYTIQRMRCDEEYDTYHNLYLITNTNTEQKAEIKIDYDFHYGLQIDRGVEKERARLTRIGLINDLEEKKSHNEEKKIRLNETDLNEMRFSELRKRIIECVVGESPKEPLGYANALVEVTINDESCKMDIVFYDVLGSIEECVNMSLKLHKSRLIYMGFTDDLGLGLGNGLKDNGEEDTEPQKLMQEAKALVKSVATDMQNGTTAYDIVCKKCGNEWKVGETDFATLTCPKCKSPIVGGFCYSIKNDFKKDNVNHPSHYNQGKIECIEAIESATIGKSGIEAVCVANVIKYLWRYEKKGGRESVEKAMWYLQRLLRVLEEK